MLDSKNYIFPHKSLALLVGISLRIVIFFTSLAFKSKVTNTVIKVFKFIYLWVKLKGSGIFLTIFTQIGVYLIFNFNDIL